MHPASFRTIVGALVAGAGGGAIWAIAFQHAPSRDAAAASEVPNVWDEAGAEPPADWCAAGFEPIDGGACFAAPHDVPARSLIVYLHGRYSRDAAGDEIDRQRRLGARANAKGMAVIAFRGRLGGCAAPELATWYCWPSSQTNADAGADVVSGWARALTGAERGVPYRRRFLLGFSNGGYFAGLIAARGLLDVDAIVVAHGGPVEPVRAPVRPPPLLLLSADDDVAQDDMIRFDEDLTRVRWPHDSYARAGAHGLADTDIDAALSFFARSEEPLPLRPPLPLHRAVRHARDAGGEIQIDDASDTPSDADLSPHDEESTRQPSPVQDEPAESD